MSFKRIRRMKALGAAGGTIRAQRDSRMSARIGLLLINLGTPDAPTPAAVRRYLREFLSDPRVLDIPPLRRFLLLELLILPRRPKVAAAAYEKIWLEGGSPLLVHGRALAAQ